MTRVTSEHEGEHGGAAGGRCTAVEGPTGTAHTSCHMQDTFGEPCH